MVLLSKKLLKDSTSHLFGFKPNANQGKFKNILLIQNKFKVSKPDAGNDGPKDAELFGYANKHNSTIYKYSRTQNIL